MYGPQIRSVIMATAGQTSSVSCPPDYICTVTPAMTRCTAVNNTLQKVGYRYSGAEWLSDGVFRFAALEVHRHFAKDLNKDGLLESWSLQSTSDDDCVDCSLYINRYVKDSQGLNLYIRDGIPYACETYKRYACCRYVKSDNTPTSPFPTEPYASQGRETYIGSVNNYACRTDLSRSGQFLYSLEYQNYGAPLMDATIVGTPITLMARETLNLSGTGQISLDVQEVYSPSQISTCQLPDGATISLGQSYCIDSKTLATCEAVADNPPVITKTYADATAIPPQVCRDGQITSAYVVKVSIDGTSIKTGGEFRVTFELSGIPDAANRDVTATLKKDLQTISTATQKTGSGTADGKTAFIIKPSEAGLYQIEISFSHEAANYLKKYDVQVAEPISVIIDVDRPVQYDSEDVSVLLKSTKSGEAKELSNYEVDAKYNLRTLTEQDIKRVEVLSAGVMKLYFALDGDGTLQVRAKGVDETGIWTDWSDYKSVSVKKATMLFKTEFVNDVCAGPHTNRFAVTDPFGQKIGASCEVTVEKPLGGEDQAALQGSGGDYSFTYSFAEPGLYVVRASAHSEKYGTAQLNGGTGQTINILGGTACGMQPTPEETPAPPMWVWAVGGGVGALIIILTINMFRKAM